MQRIFLLNIYACMRVYICVSRINIIIAQILMLPLLSENVADKNIEYQI